MQGIKQYIDPYYRDGKGKLHSGSVFVLVLSKTLRLNLLKEFIYTLTGHREGMCVAICAFRIDEKLRRPAYRGAIQSTWSIIWQHMERELSRQNWENQKTKQWYKKIPK